MSYANIGTGIKAPEVVNVVIEIPRGSHNKYEYDKELDEIRLDRVLYSPLYYPGDYGFIPQTLSEDGDPLDCLVIVSDPLFPGCVLKVRPVGVLDMEDGGKDWKILAVAEGDPRQFKIRSLEDIEEQYKNEVSHFFEQYKKLEHKRITVHGWMGREAAYKTIKEAMQRAQGSGAKLSNSKHKPG